MHRPFFDPVRWWARQREDLPPNSQCQASCMALARSICAFTMALRAAGFVVASIMSVSGSEWHCLYCLDFNMSFPRLSDKRDFP